MRIVFSRDNFLVDSIGQEYRVIKITFKFHDLFYVSGKDKTSIPEAAKLIFIWGWWPLLYIFGFNKGTHLKKMDFFQIN